MLMRGRIGAVKSIMNRIADCRFMCHAVCLYVCGAGLLLLFAAFTLLPTFWQAGFEVP